MVRGRIRPGTPALGNTFPPSPHSSGAGSPCFPLISVPIGVASSHCLRVARGDAIPRLPALRTLVDRALREISCPVRVGAVADLVAASWSRYRRAVSWFGYRLEKTCLGRTFGLDCGACSPCVLLQFIRRPGQLPAAPAGRSAFSWQQLHRLIRRHSVGCRFHTNAAHRVARNCAFFTAVEGRARVLEAWPVGNF